MGYRGDLPEINSEFIEPYLKAFLMCQIEAVACGLTTPEEARKYLSGVDYFVGNYCAIHARFATSNMYGKFKDLSDEKMIEICKKTIED